MEKRTLLGFALILLAFSANFQSISSDAFDCYDACSTGCVNQDTRLMLRCDRKCQIRCAPSDLTNGEWLAKVSGVEHP